MLNCLFTVLYCTLLARTFLIYELKYNIKRYCSKADHHQSSHDTEADIIHTFILLHYSLWMLLPSFVSFNFSFFLAFFLPYFELHTLSVFTISPIDCNIPIFYHINSSGVITELHPVFSPHLILFLSIFTTLLNPHLTLFLSIFPLFTGVFGVYGIDVNPRHLSLIADFMTRTGSYLPMNRQGMNECSSPFLQMSFETTSTFLTKAASEGGYFLPVYLVWMSRAYKLFSFITSIIFIWFSLFFTILFIHWSLIRIKRQCQLVYHVNWRGRRYIQYLSLPLSLWHSHSFFLSLSDSQLPLSQVLLTPKSHPVLE